MTQRFVFPAGRYYVGDPCYAIADEDWDKLINVTGCFGLEETELSDWKDGLYHYNYKPCWAQGTRWGDGLYSDNNNRKYGVDAGLIGIIPEDAVSDSDTEGGHFINFPVDFIVKYENGIFYFGHIKIDTN